MDLFFNTLKKGMVATVFAIFAFSAVYIPHPANEVEPAEAALATIVNQVLDNIQLIFVNIWETLSSTFNKLTSYATTYLQAKESGLDGAAWSVAKQLINTMLKSVLNWIKNGFPGGGPMFVQDLTNFMDNIAGNVLTDFLGNDISSLICSPFQLDIKISLSLKFQLNLASNPVSDCSLSSIVKNFEGFMEGSQGSFSKGGWDDWFDITSSPEKHTSFGADMQAKIAFNTRVNKAQKQEKSYLNFGGGFLSGLSCSGDKSAGTEQCGVSKPGKMIQEALTLNLDSGRQSLIEADEIDEILVGLLGQIVTNVFRDGLSDGNVASHSAPPGLQFDTDGDVVNPEYSAGWIDPNSGGVKPNDKEYVATGELEYLNSEILRIRTALGVQNKYRGLAIKYLDLLPTLDPEEGITLETAKPLDTIPGTPLDPNLVTNASYGSYMITPKPMTEVFQGQVDTFRANCLLSSNTATYLKADGANKVLCLDTNTDQKVAYLSHFSIKNNHQTPDQLCSALAGGGSRTVVPIDTANFYYGCIYTPPLDPAEGSENGRGSIIINIRNARRHANEIIDNTTEDIPKIQAVLDIITNAGVSTREEIVAALADYNFLTPYSETAMNGSVTNWDQLLISIETYEAKVGKLQTAEREVMIEGATNNPRR